ncbi:MAG TPA: universal stress protein [Blastocatellia bacterium]|jgi:nucleotide-binding universal stress UspA family protein|nr:universal stress protein [Blastocatellia bacterium]
MKPLMKLLVGYDGSECADRAIEDLRRAGLPHEGEAIVLSAADVWLWPPPEQEGAAAPPPKVEMTGLSESRRAAEQALEQARQFAQRASERLREILPAWTVTPEALADSPAWALIKKSDEWKPDLLVIGSQGRSALSRLVFGSVSEKVVTEARCSVRVARGRAEVAEGPVRIAIGLDSSPNAEAAVAAVARREWPSGSEALLISVLDMMIMTSREWIEDFKEDEEAWGAKVTNGPIQQLTDAGLAVSSMIKRGDPKRIILEEADRWKAVSIFVGAIGLRGIEKFLLGSVASSIAARAHCSAEVVRTPEQ